MAVVFLNATESTAEARIDRYALLTVLTRAQIDELETLEEGWHDAQFEVHTSWMMARLAKRYAIPQQAPYPLILELWLARLIALPAAIRIGVRQTDEVFDTVKEQEKEARADILEAANSTDGRFDLPLRADQLGSSGIVKPTTLGYSEQSPYVGFDVQAQEGRLQDQFRRGR